MSSRCLKRQFLQLAHNILPHKYSAVVPDFALQIRFSVIFINSLDKLVAHSFIPLLVAEL